MLQPSVRQLLIGVNIRMLARSGTANMTKANSPLQDGSTLHIPPRESAIYVEAFDFIQCAQCPIVGSHLRLQKYG